MALNSEKVTSRLLYLGLVLGLLHPFLYYSAFSGDGIIHLIFAQNALQGHFFQFNPGRFSGGETSPGYMLILAGLMKVFGQEVVHALVKTMGVLSLYGIGWLTWKLARLLKLPSPFPLLAAVVVLMLPGTAFNGMRGTENTLFAAGILFFTLVLLRSRWLTEPAGFSLGREALAGLVLGLLFLIRPEAAPFAGIIYSYRLFIHRRDRSTLRRALAGGVTAGVGFLLIAGGYVCFYRLYTGLMPYSAGLARSILSHMDNSIYLGNVAINVKFVKRLLVYFTLTLPALAACYLLLTRRISGEQAKITGLFLTIFAVFFLLYSTVLPSVHLGRYTAFLWPFLVLAATVSLAWFQEQGFSFPIAGGRIRTILAAVWLLLFLAAVGGETWLRHQQVVGYYRAVLAAPYLRKQEADRLFAQFGSPHELPVRLAVQEVQIRYWLDDRFVVYSLDGIVDNGLKEYIHDGTYDHLAYLRDRKIDFLQPVRNYNRDKSSWSLARLAELQPGEKTERAGLEFTMLANGWVRVRETKDGKNQALQVR